MNYPTHAFRGFTSDNAAGIHPQLLKAISDVNQDQVYAYGHDPYTDKAMATFKKHFGEHIAVHFVTNGTAVNVLAAAALVKPHEAILCTEQAHLYGSECGAIERFVGCKLLAIPTTDGKLTVALLKKHIQGLGNDHYSQPKLITLTQANEYGQVYTLAEVKALTEFAHAQGLLVYMDGARFANACAHLKLGLKTMSAEAGIDVLGFGGTKNGLLFGEALVFFNPALALDMPYIRKQAMQTVSKTRFIAAQFSVYLEDELWLKNAQIANQRAKQLAELIENLPGVSLTHPVEANLVFARLPQAALDPLQAAYPFHISNPEQQEIRLVCSFDTTEADIEGLAARLRALCG